jgi:hypothetical protein
LDGGNALTAWDGYYFHAHLLTRAL